MMSHGLQKYIHSFSLSLFFLLSFLSLLLFLFTHGTLLIKLGWVGKNGRPKRHTQGVTQVTGDVKNAEKLTEKF